MINGNLVVVPHTTEELAIVGNDVMKMFGNVDGLAFLPLPEFRRDRTRRLFIRVPAYAGWYFKVDSTETGVPAS